MKHRVVALAFLWIAITPLPSFADVAPGSDSGDFTYAGRIASILDANCVGCHRPDQIAPMSFVSYEEVRPWAKSIRESVRARTMPPWDADPAHGTWANDISLSDEEIDAVVRWVDAGAPLGDPSLRPTPPTFSSSWTIGEPDIVIDLPEFTVPPDGPDLFPDHVMKLDVPEGAWLSAVEILPGDRGVLHHVVAFLGNAAMRDAGGELGGGAAAGPPGFGAEVGIAAIWAAGMPPTVNPEGMGRPLETRQTVTFNMHYHPNGVETIDRTRVGIRLGRGPLLKRMETVAAINGGFRIPPGAEAFEARAALPIDHDSQIVSFFPHMHLRGKRFEFVLARPDGSRETLLSVPEYDFGWQWIYYPAEPVAAPAGSVVEVTGVWDNSAANPNNPDPSAAVGFGEETGDEMLIGFLDLTPESGEELPAVRPVESMTEHLVKSGHRDDGYVLRTGSMIPMASAVVLPRDSDTGSFFFRIDSALVTAPLENVRWEGNRVTARAFFLSIDLALEGTLAEDGSISVGFAAPPGAVIDDPQVGFFLRMMAKLQGNPIKA